jgi:hypothetical protein
MTRAIPSGTSEMYVEWNGLAGETFKVYRSTSPVHDFLLLKDNVVAFFCIDNTVNLYDEGNKYYYRVEGIKDGTVIETSEIFQPLYTKPDGIANKVIYESRIVLKVMNNPLVYALIKRRDELPCPECWNPVTGKIRYANCPICFGTGKLSGYHPAIMLRLSTDISQVYNASSMIDGDKVGLTPVNAWTTNVPLLTPGDVIVDTANLRFSVQNVVPRTKSHYVLRQILQLYPLEKGHPAYNFPVERSVDLK